MLLQHLVFIKHAAWDICAHSWLLKTCHNTGVYNGVFTAHTTPHSCPGSSRHTITLGSTTECLQLTPPHTPALAPQGMPQHWGLQQCLQLTPPHAPAPGSSRHATTLGSTTMCLQLTPPHTPALAPQGMPQHWVLQQCVYSSHHPTLLPWLPKACHNTGVYNSVFTAHTTPHSCPGSPRHATTLGSTTVCLQLTPPHTPALAP